MPRKAAALAHGPAEEGRLSRRVWHVRPLRQTMEQLLFTSCYIKPDFMKQVALFLLSCAFVASSHAQVVTKEKTKTKISGNTTVRKSKIETTGGTVGIPGTVTSSSSSAHSAYGSHRMATRHYVAHHVRATRRHAARRTTHHVRTVRHRTHHAHRLVHYKKYKKVVKDGKVKVKYEL
jgi:hypothetical protein